MGTERRIVRIGPVRDAAIACTLDGDETVDRLSEWRALLERALGPAEAAPDGARVRLPAEAGVEAEAQRLIEAESACCAFFSFSLEDAGDALVLTVGAPPEGRSLAEGLLGLGDGSSG